ncbi:hypothetical protein N9195_03190 [bacterium]|nr:hypothetical protein [bacterium]
MITNTIPYYRSQPVEEIYPLDYTTYVPRGSTSLLDGIGRTITELGHRLRDTPEEERPGQVIVAIFTDGQENSSTEFEMDEINRLVTQQRNVYSWNLLFLAGNQDAIATAARLGIARNLAVTVENSWHGQQANLRAAFRSILEARETAETFGSEASCELMTSYSLGNAYEDEL